MRFLSLFLAFCFATSAWAKPGVDPFELHCVTEVPTTSMVIWTEGEDLLAKVIHHNGAARAPAIVGTFTPSDLPRLERLASLTKRMQRVTTFRWPRANCRRLGGMLFQCFGTPDEQSGSGGEKIKPFALYSTRVTEDGLLGRLDYLTLRLTFTVDGQGDPYVEMKYPLEGCRLKDL